MESHIICGFFDIPQDVGHKKGIWRGTDSFHLITFGQCCLWNWWFTQFR
jgi:hypothetical protein